MGVIFFGMTSGSLVLFASLTGGSRSFSHVRWRHSMHNFLLSFHNVLSHLVNGPSVRCRWTSSDGCTAHGANAGPEDDDRRGACPWTAYSSSSQPYPRLSARDFKQHASLSRTCPRDASWCWCWCMHETPDRRACGHLWLPPLPGNKWVGIGWICRSIMLCALPSSR
jgi:hypothetical protein